MRGCAGTEGLVKRYQSNPTLVNGAVAAVAIAAGSALLFTEARLNLPLSLVPACAAGGVQRN